MTVQRLLFDLSVVLLLLGSCFSTQEELYIDSQRAQDKETECQNNNGESKSSHQDDFFDFLTTTESYRDSYPSVHKNPHYNVWSCPDKPPTYYPFQWNAVDVLNNWHPDKTSLPSHIYQGICVMDFFSEYDKAMKYLEADVPFIVRNAPDFMAAASRWHDPSYVEKLLGNETTYPLYTSSSNQFLYWRRMESPPDDWESPNHYSRTTYPEFRKFLQEDALPNETHYYMYAEGHWSLSDENHRWHLFNEFPRFKPGNTDLFHELFHQDYQTLYLKFSMKGNTAVMHLDQQRNTIVMIKGMRRYLLADPSQCPELQLRDKSHPSSRHTTLELRNFPENSNMKMNEVIVQPGDALILPSFWFHSVIGLTPGDNIQANAWSTATANKKRIIQECGNFI